MGAICHPAHYTTHETADGLIVRESDSVNLEIQAMRRELQDLRARAVSDNKKEDPGLHNNMNLEIQAMRRELHELRAMRDDPLHELKENLGQLQTGMETLKGLVRDVHGQVQSPTIQSPMKSPREGAIAVDCGQGETQTESTGAASDKELQAKRHYELKEQMGRLQLDLDRMKNVVIDAHGEQLPSFERVLAGHDRLADMNSLSARSNDMKLKANSSPSVVDSFITPQLSVLVVAHIEFEYALRRAHKFVDGWTMDSFDAETAKSNVNAMFDSIFDVAQGGTFICMGPRDDIRRLVPYTQSVDQGYMTRKLKGVNITSNEFRNILRLFTEHGSSDRWPEDYEDVEARNLSDHVFLSTLTDYLVRHRGDGAPYILAFSDDSVQHRLNDEQPHLHSWDEARLLLIQEAIRNPGASPHSDCVGGEIPEKVRTLLKDANPTSELYINQARGQPKDGSIILSHTGDCLMAAVKIINLPRAGVSWHGTGARHEAALQTAQFLRNAIVLVRSDSGSVHVLFSKGDHLQDEPPDAFEVIPRQVTGGI